MIVNRLNGMPTRPAVPATPVAGLNPGRLLSTYEVTQFLGISKRTLWRWIKEGKLPAPITLSRRVRRWAASDLLPLLQNRRGGPDA